MYNDLFLDPLDVASKMNGSNHFNHTFMIGLCLEVDLDQMVEYDDNSSCLASVLDAWKRTGSSPYTWRSFYCQFLNK